jgi:flagellar biosynthesis chaperone FliJ
VNLSVLVQLAFLASLIVGSWVNLQRQLDSLQRDVTSLLENQKRFTEKVEHLQEKSISHEFRLKLLETTKTPSHKENK